MRLEQRQTDELRKISRAHDLRFVILHGSQAKGTAGAGADIDVAVVGNRPLPFDEYLALHGELAEVFGDDPERELDLKTLHGVDPLFRYQVTRDGVLLFGDPTAYEEFKAFAFRDYVDSSDLRKLEKLLLQKSIQKLSQRYAG